MPNQNRRRTTLIISVLAVLLVAAGAVAWATGLFRSTPAPSSAPTPSPVLPATASPTTSASPVPAPTAVGATSHYEYVFPDGGMDVYDADAGWKLVKHVDLPTRDGVRGAGIGVPTAMAYISHGGDGGFHGNGSLLAYDLVAERIVYDVAYGHGIDSFSVTPDGTRIYMPDGELTQDTNWYVIDAATGKETGRLQGGKGPHNTVVSSSGQHVYLGGRFDDHLIEADTATGQVIKRIGPLRQDVRPFAISTDERYAFTTASDHLGFQVSDVASGRVLHDVPVTGFHRDPPFAVSGSSHGITVSPDSRELYVVDQPNSYVHVFDITGLPAAAPRRVADIALDPPLGSGVSTNCAYDCQKESWLQHSMDGRYVYVGDSGDVIDTATRTVVAVLPAMSNSRKMLEVDWAGDRVAASSERNNERVIAR